MSLERKISGKYLSIFVSIHLSFFYFCILVLLASQALEDCSERPNELLIRIINVIVGDNDASEGRQCLLCVNTNGGVK